jgi:hypothetical protein
MCRLVANRNDGPLARRRNHRSVSRVRRLILRGRAADQKVGGRAVILPEERRSTALCFPWRPF